MSASKTMSCRTCGATGTTATCPLDGGVLVSAKALQKYPNDPLLGSYIKEKYRVIDLLGRGGFGTVYRAVDESIDRTVAIKTIRNMGRDDLEDLRVRFYREARVLGRLDDGICVSIYEYGEHQGHLFMVMQYIRGLTLRQVIRKSGAMEPRRAIDLASQILRGLATAHNHKLVHRDIKPANIMVTVDSTGEERIKLLDFGIAKLAKDPGEEETISTEQGMTLGSPAYMAPEQARAEPTAQSDLYSVGIVLFEMLTGRRPFTSPRSIEVLMMHQQTPVPLYMDEVGVSLTLQAVVLRALEKKTAQRWGSAVEMLRALHAGGGARDTPVEMVTTETEPEDDDLETETSIPAILGSVSALGEVAEMPEQTSHRSLKIAALIGVGLVIGISYLAMRSPVDEPSPVTQPVRTARPVKVKVQPVEPPKSMNSPEDPKISPKPVKIKPKQPVPLEEAPQVETVKDSGKVKKPVSKVKKPISKPKKTDTEKTRVW